MVLPSPSGKYSVGVIEVDVPAPTSVGVVPIVIYYPAVSTGTGSPQKQQQPLQWIDKAHAEAVGKVHLKDTFGVYSGGMLMSTFGPLATGYARVQATVGAKLLADREWPVAVLSHSLSGWRHINSTYLVEIASHGAVTIALEHCDRSACLATSNNPPGSVLATYAEIEEVIASNKGKDGFDAAMNFRHSQCDQRRLEIIAALDGVEAALREHFREQGLSSSRLCRSDRDVAVLGQSFGGASAACCVLSAQHAHRFSHCFLYDPWIEGEGNKTLPLRRSDLDNPFSSSLKTLVIWRDGHSILWKSCKKNWDALAAKFPETVVHDYMECGHFAQTDAPVVFESGPLAFLYKAIKGTSGEPDAGLMLRQSTTETISALDGWFHIDDDSAEQPELCTPSETTR